jgi:ABC-type transport system substrate-binding protein
MNPYDSLDFGCSMVQQQVFETLYRRSGEQVIPWLAADMPRPRATGRGACYEIPLRKDVRFSDGSELSPEDVVHSLSHTRRFADAPRLEAKDGAIEIELGRADLGLASALATPRTAITRPRETTANASHLDAHIGTGPWCMASDFTPSDARLRPNAFYWGTHPKLTDLRFHRFELDDGGQPSALIQAIENGQVDLTTVLTPRDAKKVDNARHLIRPGCSTALLWMNLERLVQPRLREAIVCAIDRYGLAEKSYLHPERFVASSVLPPGLHGRHDRYRYDKTRARECLDQLGAPPPPLRMLVIWGPRPYLPAPRNWARALQDMFEKVQLECEVVQTRDPHDYQERIRSGDYDLVLGGWTADTEDPCDFVEALYDPVVIPSPHDVVATGCNFSRMDDPIVTNTLAQYRETRSSEVLDELLTRAEQLMGVLPLAYGPTIAVHGWHVAGFRTDALGIPDFGALCLRL